MYVKVQWKVACTMKGRQTYKLLGFYKILHKQPSLISPKTPCEASLQSDFGKATDLIIHYAGLPDRPARLVQRQCFRTSWVKLWKSTAIEGACRRKRAEGGVNTPSWVSGSDRASMIGDARSLQYEERFQQPAWREAHRTGKSYREWVREIDRGENLREGKQGEGRVVFGPRRRSACFIKWGSNPG